MEGFWPPPNPVDMPLVVHAVVTIEIITLINKYLNTSNK